MNGKPAGAEARTPNHLRPHCDEPKFLQSVCDELGY